MIVKTADTAMLIVLVGSEDEDDAVEEDLYDDIHSVYDVADAGDHGQLENAGEEHSETGENTNEKTNIFQGKDFTGRGQLPELLELPERTIVRPPECVDETTNANTPRDAFSLFITDILNFILTHTPMKKFMIISSTSIARFRNGCGEFHWMNFVLSLTY